jgi:glycolate oxidase FAD binding subunit
VLRVANERELSVIPRGGGTKIGWGNAPRSADVVLSTERLNRLLEHAHGDMTATVEAGMTVGALQRALAEQGQMLALDPAWPEHATIGGVIAADASGPLRARYGTMRDLLIGIGVVLPDGTIAHGGGKVVKNVAGYDLMKLFTGSLGTLGLITTATVRLHPRPAATTALSIEPCTAQDANAFMLELSALPLTPTGVQIVATGEGYKLCVRLAGVEASVAAQSAKVIERAAEINMVARPLDDAEAQTAWREHETIYAGAGNAVVARWSVLPAAVAAALELFEEIGQRLRLGQRVVAQATGTGLVRFEGANEQALLAALGAARSRIGALGGNFVVHLLPVESKERLDVWGPAGSTLALMRRVKAQFDPRGIMNPGRYVGRI